MKLPSHSQTRSAAIEVGMENGQEISSHILQGMWLLTHAGISYSVVAREKERERERLSLSAFLRTEDIGVHMVHISRLIMTYTLE